jgi:selenocysteine lyase/cysteine desulfurase
VTLSPDAPPATLDATALRGDFPILGREIDGRPLVYLDSAATSQKPRAVIDAEVDFLTRENAAVHRGAHTLAAEATELFEEARATVAGFVGAAPEQLVWTSGATAGLNLIAYAIGNAAAAPPRAPGSPSRAATRSSSPRPSTTRTSCPGRSSPPAPGRCCATSA